MVVVAIVHVDVVRCGCGDRVLFLHVHVRLLAQTERAVRSAADSAVRQPGRSGGGRGTSNGPVQPCVQRVLWPPVRRAVPDAYPAPVDLRPRAHRPDANQLLCILLGPRRV